MRIQAIELVEFRNYERFLLEPSPSLTILVGPNAAGKTNLIEAVQLVTSAQSFRRPKFEDVVRWGCEEARVRLRAEGEGRLLETELSLDRAGRRTYRVNGQTKRRFHDVTGLLPSVVFTPDDIGMVKGPAERRRSAVDDLGEQLSSTYGALRRDYGRVVKHRNTLLKDGVWGADMEAWDDQLVTLGARLLSHRARLLRRIIDHAAAAYSRMAYGEELSHNYDDRCGLGDEGSADDPVSAASALRDELRRRSAEERRRGVTLVGPHRDDISFFVGGKDAKAFASQGQQRTVALAWKLAEVEVVREVLRVDPVLLLDDVMSELDAERRTALAELIAGDIQTIVTTTNTGYFTPELLGRAAVVMIGGDAA